MFEYENLSMEIILNRMGYDQNDVNDLFHEPFSTMYRTKIGYEWHPSVVGDSMLEINLIIGGVIGGITAGFLNQIGLDLYNWAKNSLKKVIDRKERNFDNSIVTIKLNDTCIIIYVNDKEEILLAIEKINAIINYLHNFEKLEEYIDLSIEDLRKL